MSYNQAYEQDTGENVSYNSFYILDVIRRNTLLPVIIKGPKIPPPPPFGSSTIDYSSLNQYTLDSIGSEWTEIKYLPGTATAWFPGNERWNYTFTEFLFTRGDFSAWFICDKFQAVGEFFNGTPRTITKSSISDTPYTAVWFNRGYLLDPVLSLEDYSISERNNTIMYIEDSHTAARNSISPSGMYVFIR